MTLSRLLLSISFLSVLTACNLTPEYNKPETAVPPQFKEEVKQLEGQWAPAMENAGDTDRSAWWTVFGDKQLDALQNEAAKSNQTIKIAAARLEQADALMRQANASFLPSLSIAGNAGRSDQGADRKPASNFQILGIASYEPDLFGRIRNTAEIARMNKESQEQLYHQALLLVHADVAQNYYTILALDTERDLLHQTITLREDATKLIKSRFDLGETSEQDYLRAQVQLASAQADLTALDQRRALAEHALAILTGKPPAEVNLAEAKLPNNLPLIPAGLPARLLERRPDIAAAEKQVAAANARIGVARAAFFPNLSLTAIGGFASSELGDVFKWSSRTWILGPLFGTALSLPVFDGGNRLAGIDLAKAGHEEAVANYRQQVLVAFKDVEDSLSNLRLQGQQAKELYRAADAATKANHISDVRYKEGETSYLEVIDTERDALAAQRAYTQVQGQRFISTINMIRALGGGWDTALVPVPQVVQPAAPVPLVREKLGSTR
jgi:multidrug efflux system outer membrane protein